MHELFVAGLVASIGSLGDIPHTADYSTTLYYLFSTIAQTFAGLIGFLAAFAIIRFGDLNRQILERTSGIYNARDCATIDTNRPPTDIEVQQWYINGDYDKLIDLFSKHPNLVKGQTNTLPIAKNILEQKRTLIRRFHSFLTITIALIVYSLLILALVPFVLPYDALSIGLVIAALVWAVFVVFSFSRLFKSFI